jgi:hypothetical protein
MRLHITLNGIVLLDLTVLEPEDMGEPMDVHDLSTGHEIGFGDGTRLQGELRR